MNYKSIIIFCVYLSIMSTAFNAYSNQSELSQTQDHEDTQLHSSDDKKKQTIGQKLFMTLVIALPLGMGILGVNKWLEEYKSVQETKNWSSVVGTVKEKTFETHMATVKNQTGSTVLLEQYKPKIIYSYDDRFKEYTYDTINYSDSGFTDEATASEELNEYPNVGEPVTIYISPNKQNAVLKNSVSKSSYILLIGSSIFTLLGLYGIKNIWL